VFGIFSTPSQAESAVDALVHAGFTAGDISVLLPDRASTKAFAHEKSTKAPEGTTTGAVAGGTVGGGLGLLVGIGALAIPGLGPFIATGPIMATLAGIGAGGAVGGVSARSSAWAFQDTRRSEGRVKDGGVLLSHALRYVRRSRAQEVLKNLGASDISSTGEAGSDERPWRSATRRTLAPDVRRKEGTDRPSVPRNARDTELTWSSRKDAMNS
jgi:hypothetical protein